MVCCSRSRFVPTLSVRAVRCIWRISRFARPAGAIHSFSRCCLVFSCESGQLDVSADANGERPETKSGAASFRGELDSKVLRTARQTSGYASSHGTRCRNINPGVERYCLRHRIWERYRRLRWRWNERMNKALQDMPAEMRGETSDYYLTQFLQGVQRRRDTLS